MYGTPENSPYVSGFDAGQYASATNSVSSGSSYNWGKAAGSAISADTSAIGGIMSAYALSDQNAKTIDQLLYEMRRNKAKMLYEWKKSDASNQLSFWQRGIAPTSGSAAGVLKSNKAIVDDNIRDMERAVNTQIENLRAQSKNAIVSSWISGVGNIAGAFVGGFGG